MYNKVALNITNWFIKRGIIDSTKKTIYQYGFEVLISSLMYFLFFLLISMITDSIIPSILFWLGLFFVRKIAGGHHAKSYTACHIHFEVNHILFILLFKFFPQSWYRISIIGIIMFCFISILLFAPVDHANKPFINNEYNRFRILSLIYCAVLLIVLALSIIKFLPNNNYLFAYSIGSLSATISLLSGKIIRFIERKKT